MCKKIKKFFTAVCAVCVSMVSIFGAGCKEEQTPEKPQMQVIENTNCTSYIDVSYGSHERNYMDICIPNGASGTLGVILMIHGGGWISGDKIAYRNSLEYWSGEQGFVTLAINYRYANVEIYAPDLLDDITAALYKAKNFALDLGITLEKMLLTGGSAGAHLSLLYAYTKAETAPITPAAVCSLSGPTDLTDGNYYKQGPLLEGILNMITKVSGVEFDETTVHNALPNLRAASPVEYITENTVPTIICQGQLDDIVPLSNGVVLADKLTKYGVTNKLFVYPHSGHGLESDPEIAAQADALMLEYARTYLE